jgi:hypothetical protein
MKQLFILFLKQFKSHKIILLSIIAACIIFFALLVLISNAFQIPFSEFTRDTLAVLGAKERYHIGFVSNLGGGIWATSFGVCLLSFWILRSIYKAFNEANFFLIGAFFSLLLFTDDIFLLHDAVLPYLALSSTLFILGYTCLLLVYFAWYIKVILDSPFLILLIALGAFFMSLVVDTHILDKLAGSNLNQQLQYILEDGSKFLGVVCWCTYYTLSALSSIKALALKPANLST